MQQIRQELAANDDLEGTAPVDSAAQNWSRYSTQLNRCPYKNGPQRKLNHACIERRPLKLLVPAEQGQRFAWSLNECVTCRNALQRPPPKSKTNIQPSARRASRRLRSDAAQSGLGRDGVSGSAERCAHAWRVCVDEVTRISRLTTVSLRRPRSRPMLGDGCQSSISRGVTSVARPMQGQALWIWQSRARLDTCAYS